MNEYEGMFILNPELAGDASKKVVESIGDLIKKQKGTVTQVKEWGRRRLVYLIKKKREGVYLVYNFSMNAEGIDRLKSGYLLNENIYKFMITQKLKIRPFRIRRKKSESKAKVKA
jgi:small subunit ribosomal protein S6